MLITCSSKMCL